jgi:hypothetical protein
MNIFESYFLVLMVFMVTLSLVSRFLSEDVPLDIVLLQFLVVFFGGSIVGLEVAMMLSVVDHDVQILTEIIVAHFLASE